MKESAKKYHKLPRHCRNHRGKRVFGTHHNPPMVVHIEGEELRQVLITKVAIETTKRGIKVSVF